MHFSALIHEVAMFIEKGVGVYEAHEVQTGCFTFIVCFLVPLCHNGSLC